MYCSGKSGKRVQKVEISAAGKNILSSQICNIIDNFPMSTMRPQQQQLQDYIYANHIACL